MENDGHAFLDANALRNWQADSLPPDDHDPLKSAHDAAVRGGCAGPGQQLGERWPVGCVALEITQRCNLDCTLCYLSEHSEAVRDLPLESIFERIDLIRAHYGTGIDVQITGGDPTLRDHDELVAIVERLCMQGQRPTLMTNGIKADRALLQRLSNAGLVDVAFHVDTTQERKGYDSEIALNAIRREYLEASRGLGLSVMFNTTIHAGNLHEIADLVRFFRDHASMIRTVSFQLQADTGRGVLRGRDADVSADSIWRRISDGLGFTLDTDAIRVGHPRCTRYALAMVVGDSAFDLLSDRSFVHGLQSATAELGMPRGTPVTVIKRFASWLAKHPVWIPGLLSNGLRLAADAALDLVAARGRVHTLSIMTHDFMHASALEPCRIESCVFKTMTAEGPISMCLHNARRDDFILAPVRLSDGAWFDPLAGTRGPVPVAAPIRAPEQHGLKRARGRTRRRLLAERAAS